MWRNPSQRLYTLQSRLDIVLPYDSLMEQRVLWRVCNASQSRIVANDFQKLVVIDMEWSLGQTIFRVSWGYENL